MTATNIYLVAWWFDTLGGMERHMTDAAIALARRGCNVTVFSEMPVAPGNQYIGALKEAGICVILPRKTSELADRVTDSRLNRRIEQWQFDRLGKANGMLETYRREQVNCLQTRALFKAMTKRAKLFPPDVIHVHGCRLGQREIMQWATARHYPCVYTEHVTIGDWGGPFDPTSPQVVTSTVDVIATVSDYSRKSLLSYFPEGTEVQVVHHVVRDPWDGDPAASLPQASRDRPAKLVAVGRLAPHKGYETLLRAVADLRERGIALSLRIAGSGEQQAELEALSRSLDLAECVTFLGHVQQDKVTALWRDADIAVLPSLTEGLPLSVVEAMAQGRPVVASQVGGIPEVVIDGENGLLAPPGDAAALADALRRIITDPQLAASLAAGARKSFEQGGWSETAVTDQLLAIYQKAAQSSARKKEVHMARIMTGDTLEWAKEIIGPLRRIYFCAWHVGEGDMERLFAEQACALAETGIFVTLFVEQPVRQRNRYVRAMRAAGVRIVNGSRLRTMTNRTRAWITKDWLSTPLSCAFAKACASQRPDAVYVHGWRMASGWWSLTRMLAYAAGEKLATVYVEHADDDYGSPAPDETAHDLISLFGSLSAASAGAARYLTERTGGERPVPIIRHAGHQPSEKRQSDVNGEHRISVFSLLPPAETKKLEKTLAAKSIQVTAAGALDTHALQIAESDAAVLSPDIEGYGMALAEAMSSFKPVVIAGEADTSPISHRANGIAAALDPAAAVIELASDPLLAHQLARAARKTFEANGLHSMAVVGEAVALYRAANSKGASANARR